MDSVIDRIAEERSLKTTAVLRNPLFAETLVRSVHEAGDLTSNLLRRVGIRLDRFGGQLVTGDDAADLRELNAVLLGNLEDDFRISEFTALVDDQASQLTGPHGKVGHSQPHHYFSGTLAESSNFVKNGFFLLSLLPYLLGLQFLLEFPDGFTLNVHAFGIVCIVSDRIEPGVCVLRINASSLDRAIERYSGEFVLGKIKAVIQQVIEDGKTVVLLLLDRLMENTVEIHDNLHNTVGFEISSCGHTTLLEFVNFADVSVGTKGEVTEIHQCRPKLVVQIRIGHQCDLGGDTFLVDGVQDVNESGASSLFHDWTLLSVFVEGGVANTIDLLVPPSDERINPGFQEPFILGVKGRTR